MEPRSGGFYARRNLPVTIAGTRLPPNARLKLHKLENHVAQPLEEFALCDVPGAGALYQVTIAAEGLRKSDDWTSFSFLEGIMRAYIDGAKSPTELSSGLEDYFLAPITSIAVATPTGWLD